MFPLKNTEAYIHANGFRSTLGKELADRDAAISGLGSEIQALTNEVRGNWATGGVNLFDKSIMFDVDYEGVYKELHLKPNTTYTASTTLPKNANNAANFFAYNSSGSASTNVSGLWEGQTRTITTNNDGIMNVMYRNREYEDTSVSWFLNHEFQIEEGATATEYQPYAKTNVELTADATYKTGDTIAISSNPLYLSALFQDSKHLRLTIPTNKPISASGATVTINSMQVFNNGNYEEISSGLTTTAYKVDGIGLYVIIENAVDFTTFTALANATIRFSNASIAFT